MCVNSQREDNIGGFSTPENTNELTKLLSVLSYKRYIPKVRDPQYSFKSLFQAIDLMPVDYKLLCH